MFRIITRRFHSIIIIGFFFICMTTCNKESDDCSSNEYYITYTANGQRICYSICMAATDSIPYYSTSVFRSSIMTLILSGDIIERNDTNWFDSKISFGFPGDTVGIYDNKDINGVDYFAYFKTDNGDYTFPLYEINSSEYKGIFELNIIEYNLEGKVIKGIFEGLLFSHEQKDSLVITDGEFEAYITEF